jgi:hypothetical protein
MQQLVAGRSAVVAPGGGYGADGPLLMYARLAVEGRGGHVRPIVWELSRGSDFSQQRLRVVSQVELAVEELTAATGAAPVIIGKSLGSLAAPVAAHLASALVFCLALPVPEMKKQGMNQRQTQLTPSSLLFLRLTGQAQFSRRERSARRVELECQKVGVIFD